ncbi:unnamed protein product [Brassica oleracea var. botrytis]
MFSICHALQATLTQATVNVHRLNTFRHLFNVGSMYSVSGFDVTHSNLNFKLSDSPVSIRFNDETDFKDLTETNFLKNISGSTILKTLLVRSHDQLLGLANTNTHLPVTLQKDKTRVMATITLDSGVSVTMSVFDSQAVSFHIKKKIEGYKADSRVVVATCINPKLIGGRMFLNTISGPHFYLDKETEAVESYFYKLVTNDTGNTSAASLLRGYAKVERLTIAELNQFIITGASDLLATLHMFVSTIVLSSVYGYNIYNCREHNLPALRKSPLSRQKMDGATYLAPSVQGNYRGLEECLIFCMHVLQSN